jgi:hypothetical protein
MRGAASRLNSQARTAARPAASLRGTLQRTDSRLARTNSSTRNKYRQRARKPGLFRCTRAGLTIPRRQAGNSSTPAAALNTTEERRNRLRLRSVRNETAGRQHPARGFGEIFLVLRDARSERQRNARMKPEERYARKETSERDARTERRNERRGPAGRNDR